MGGRRWRHARWMNLSERHEEQPFLDRTFALPVDRPFTRAQARAEGFPDARLGRLVALGLLRRPIKGVYVASQVADSPRLRAHCLSLVVPSDYVVCDRHAGWLLGADMILAPGEHLDLRPISVFRPSGHGRLRNDLCDSGERNLTRSDVVEVGGLAVTSPLRTAWDLGRVRSREQALSGLDAMLRLGIFTAPELIRGVERFRGIRWVTRLRELAPLADGRAASPGESVLRLRWLNKTRRLAGSEDDVSGLSASTEKLEGLVEDHLSLLVGAAFLHVGEVGLVGLDLGRRWRVVTVQRRR